MTATQPAAALNAVSMGHFRRSRTGSTGYAARMATPEDRERESQATDETKFERELDEEESLREDRADDLDEELPPAN